MKKSVLLLAAVATLAACAKNEVIPAFSAEENEITFNVAPKTKALSDTQTDFSHDNVFASYAYYLGPDKTWANDAAEAQLYIDKSTISYKNDIWKNAQVTYYWPKDGGSLTFFAYSLNKGDLTFGDHSGMGCTTSGINGAFDVITNKNVDFLVADIAADKTANEKTYDHNGVPTLFKHKLSQVTFTAKVAEKYDSKTFTVKSIKFLNISHQCTYNQIPEAMVESGAKVDQTYADNIGNVVTEQPVAVDPVINGSDGNKTDDGQYLYIPQTFGDDNLLEVRYTVTTEVGQNKVVENCVKTFKIKDIFPKWEMGKRYAFNITFSLDEIHWDPAVEDWSDEAAGNIEIDK